MEQIYKNLEYYYFSKELEQNWQSSIKITDKELIDTFPEAKKIIPLKIEELKEQRKELMNWMKNFQKQVTAIAAAEKKDEIFIWFWRHAVLKYFVAPKVVAIDKRLAMLKMQQRLLNPIKHSGNYTDWQILNERARNVHLVDLATPYLQKIRHSGNRTTGLCPFHQEKSPSFTIFENTNTFYCFGCQAKGDSIAFLMMAQKIDYKTAVKELTV